MKLFLKKNSKKDCCGTCSEETMQKALENQQNGSRVKVLGSGCAKCITLEKNVKNALHALGQTETIDHVTDFSDIASYGVMSTPALVIDGKVVAYGKAISEEEIIKILKTHF